jgi:hypothetical protein
VGAQSTYRYRVQSSVWRLPDGDGVGVQYFGRRQTMDWPLIVYLALLELHVFYASGFCLWFLRSFCKAEAEAMFKLLPSWFAEFPSAL